MKKTKQLWKKSHKPPSEALKEFLEKMCKSKYIFVTLNGKADGPVFKMDVETTFRIVLFCYSLRGRL